MDKSNLSRRVSTDVYVILRNSQGQVVMRRPSGPATNPDPSPILTKDIPVQHVPRFDNPGLGSGRYAGTFRPDPDAVVLGSTDDPDGQYRAIAVSVPQGTLITSLSLNPTNDTLGSLRKIEILASLAVLLTLCVLTTVFVRRGLRPLREMAGTADTIASGDLSRRVPQAQTESKDEVGRLGVALNKMLTQIESAFAEKSASEERLRQFVADASHELRTPLTSIRGYAELMGRGGFSDEQGRNKALKRIEEEAARMGGLVEDLLLLAELDRGRPLRLEPVDLHRICADAVGDSVAVAQSHQLVLMPGGSVVVIGDAERLAQVAHNLVRNALAHTPAGTRVEASTRARVRHGRDRGLGQRSGPPARRGGPGLRPLLPGRQVSLGQRYRIGSGHRARHRRGARGDGRVPGRPRRRGLGRRAHSAGRLPGGRPHAGVAAGPVSPAALRTRARRSRAPSRASRWSRPPRPRDPNRPRCPPRLGARGGRSSH